MKKKNTMDPVSIILIVLIIIGILVIFNDEKVANETEMPERNTDIAENETLVSENETILLIAETVITNKVQCVIDEITWQQSSIWDVPLDAELQTYIDAICVNSPIEPELILAMCEVESQYNPDAVGDNGRSLGLLQINPGWHMERMVRLQCPDLMNPYNNITVALDILEELYEDYDGNIEKVLMAYNGGHAYAESRTEPSEYALSVIKRANELKENRNV